jgi:hypothetical protein
VSDIDYEKYLIRKPIYEVGTGLKNCQSPAMTYMSSAQVPEANYYLTVSWIYGIPDPNPHIYEHVHDYDEIILHWGGKSDIPQVLGGEIEFYIGGQPIIFNTTTAIFIPKGTPHGPMTWRKFEFPHLQMTLLLGTGNRIEESKKSGINVPKKELPKKTTKFDYEQYVVRSPMREVGSGLQKSRQSPTMTYMSNTQVNAAKYYIEFGWIWGIVDGGINQMVHNNFEEIVLHIGGDPENPEDLGADMEFGIGGKPWRYNSNAVAFIPKGISHGPLKWYEVRKPHIEMAVMLGAGSWIEGWSDSGIDRPSEGRQ